MKTEVLTVIAEAKCWAVLYQGKTFLKNSVKEKNVPTLFSSRRNAQDWIWVHLDQKDIKQCRPVRVFVEAKKPYKPKGKVVKPNPKP